MTEFAGRGLDNDFLKGFWRFLKSKKDFKFSAFSSYKSGFTLAEVLITLGIIGIVVAMTLPALIADHREKQTVNQVLAFYSKISQATQYIINEEGDPDVWLSEGNISFNSMVLSNKYKKYLKVLTDCGLTGTGCVFPKYVRADKGNIPGAGFSGNGSVRYSLILEDGSAVVFMADSPFGKLPSSKNKKRYGVIYYDTNGIKPPNKFGYDMFQFALTDDGIYVFLEKEFKRDIYAGYYDSYWVVTHKNLDYQRCPNEIKAGALGCKKKKK